MADGVKHTWMLVRGSRGGLGSRLGAAHVGPSFLLAVGGAARFWKAQGGQLCEAGPITALGGDGPVSQMRNLTHRLRLTCSGQSYNPWRPGLQILLLLYHLGGLPPIPAVYKQVA